MSLWHPVTKDIWQGRDDRAESPLALRLFQTVTQCEAFTPQTVDSPIALLGFECDVGVRRNLGRPGAAQAPDVLRKALANMASHQQQGRLADFGNIRAEGDALEAAQQALHDAALACLREGKRTLVLGGGHETAFGHGSAVLDAFPDENIAIVNLDAHLDLRRADRASSGTPFRQLALQCEAQKRTFSYSCFGVSRAANTAALWQEAALRGVTVLEDLELLNPRDPKPWEVIQQIIDNHDKIYLTIDLDVLPASEMPAVSAPAAPGIPLALLLQVVTLFCQSGKLQAVDLVEFNPHYDLDGRSARTAARMAWHIVHSWP